MPTPMSKPLRPATAGAPAATGTQRGAHSGVVAPVVPAAPVPAPAGSGRKGLLIGVGIGVVVLIAIGIKVIDRGDKPSSPLAQRADSTPSPTVAAATSAQNPPADTTKPTTTVAAALPPKANVSRPGSLRHRPCQSPTYAGRRRSPQRRLRTRGAPWRRRGASADRDPTGWPAARERVPPPPRAAPRWCPTRHRPADRAPTPQPWAAGASSPPLRRRPGLRRASVSPARRGRR